MFKINLGGRLQAWSNRPPQNCTEKCDKGLEFLLWNSKRKVMKASEIEEPTPLERP